jgi:hypothetical protein
MVMKNTFKVLNYSKYAAMRKEFTSRIYKTGCQNVGCATSSLESAVLYSILSTDLYSSYLTN